LAATGRGHLTDQAISAILKPVEIVWRPEEQLPLHPNGLVLEAMDDRGDSLARWSGYSPGGGAVWDEQGRPLQGGAKNAYRQKSLSSILRWAGRNRQPLWKLVDRCEGPEIWDHLARAWSVMRAAIDRGLRARGRLPGSLRLPRKARAFFHRAGDNPRGRLIAYALAVSEENAGGGEVCTAPTCGSCGVLPAVLRHVQETRSIGNARIPHALAVAGLIGNLVKTNASISGAQVGCQGEVGAACAMAAAAAAFLMDAAPAQIEYAAEMGLEHHLGLTCDPIAGLVQIPCIERNAFAALRAMDCARYALLSDGTHKVSFDQVVQVLLETGRDLPSGYRETSLGGLSKVRLGSFKSTRQT
ncbi:MAG TPA: L-serine ammonia-lyase, iron-sulfur-dependent, subunit alpha, partial [Phycisphaerae bacterium]|nr:L-serine ammonia-lyase, iron-sulfur-dependent, subunit alpha [Phycisphaerae bacterium]